jgi:mannose-6-phosphate isomerase
MSIRPKTIFCDIDGTLWNHVGEVNKQATCDNYTLCNNTKDAINLWEKSGYKIILTTGRKENLRNITETHLQKNGIVYDQLIMGLGGGDRILINDRKQNGTRNTAYAVNVVRNSGIHNYDFNSKYVVISDDQPKKVNKPWGSEELIEYNDHYVVKKLFMKKGECCSMQYHEAKRETIYVLSGKIKMYLGTVNNDIDNIDNLDYRIMEANESITIEPYTIHRVEGIEDSFYLESSTNELWDVIRLKDKYKRENTNEMDYQ